MPPLISCPRADRWFRGCRFEARYDEVPNPRTAGLTKINGSPDALKAILCLRVYVRDVCTRCGATIERTPTND